MNKKGSTTTINKTYPFNLEEYYARREIWKKKPQIRLVYERWVEKMRKFIRQGTLLEVGSGSGLLKDFLPEVILSDVVDLPWIDRIVDCMQMPFDDASLSGVICIDLIHHVSDPHAFLREVARVLMPGGRLLLIEPYITPFSYFGYKLLHHEDINFREYHRGVDKSEKKVDPWQGNLALPNIVLKRDLKNWDTLQPDLEIVYKEYLSFFDFQFAAGFKPYAYVPFWLFKILVKIDDWLSFLMPFIAFRIFVVMAKRSRMSPYKQPAKNETL